MFILENIDYCNSLLHILLFVTMETKSSKTTDIFIKIPTVLQPSRYNTETKTATNKHQFSWE